MSTTPNALAVAERFMNALERADADAVRKIYSPDARIWHNFDEKLQTVEENIKAMRWMHRVLNNLRYDIQRGEVLPDGFLQQHILRGTLASGDAFALHACAICQVDGENIVALEEYLDLAQTAVLTAKPQSETNT